MRAPAQRLRRATASARSRAGWWPRSRTRRPSRRSPRRAAAPVEVVDLQITYLAWPRSGRCARRARVLERDRGVRDRARRDRRHRRRRPAHDDRPAWSQCAHDGRSAIRRAGRAGQPGHAGRAARGRSSRRAGRHARRRRGRRPRSPARRRAATCASGALLEMADSVGGLCGGLAALPGLGRVDEPDAARRPGPHARSARARRATCCAPAATRWSRRSQIRDAGDGDRLDRRRRAHLRGPRARRRPARYDRPLALVAPDGPDPAPPLLDFLGIAPHGRRDARARDHRPAPQPLGHPARRRHRGARRPRRARTPPAATRRPPTPCSTSSPRVASARRSRATDRARRAADGTLVRVEVRRRRAPDDRLMVVAVATVRPDPTQAGGHVTGRRGVPRTIYVACGEVARPRSAGEHRWETAEPAASTPSSRLRFGSPGVTSRTTRRCRRRPRSSRASRHCLAARRRRSPRRRRAPPRGRPSSGRARAPRVLRRRARRSAERQAAARHHAAESRGPTAYTRCDGGADPVWSSIRSPGPEGPAASVDRVDDPHVRDRVGRRCQHRRRRRAPRRRTPRAGRCTSASSRPSTRIRALRCRRAAHGHPVPELRPGRVEDAQLALGADHPTPILQQRARPAARTSSCRVTPPG